MRTSSEAPSPIVDEEITSIFKPRRLCSLSSYAAVSQRERHHGILVDSKDGNVPKCSSFLCELSNERTNDRMLYSRRKVVEVEIDCISSISG